MAFLIGPAFAATTYTVSVRTDAASYSAAQPITTSGIVSPAPGPNTAVIVTMINPDGKTVVDIQDDPVNPSTGAYTQITVAGGSAGWVAGTYSVNATWGGNGSTATMITTFAYSPTPTSTTTSSTTTTTTSTTTSSSTSKTTTTTSSTSTTTTTSVPVSSTTTTTGPTSTSPPASTGSTTTSTNTTESGGGLGSLTYVIIAVVAIVIVGLGIVMWRRRVASGFGQKGTTP
jgi:cobalamin biosynthesis Mg chelatase CobN